MSITLNLPQELEHELMAEANQVGLSLSQYILQQLAGQRPVNRHPKTGQELVAYWQQEGLYGYRTDIIDSQHYARVLRHQVEQRHDR